MLITLAPCRNLFEKKKQLENQIADNFRVIRMHIIDLTEKKENMWQKAIYLPAKDNVS